MLVREGTTVSSECLAVTRNGRGRVYRLSSLAEARLSPVVQIGDPILCSAQDIPRNYGFRDGAELLSMLPEGRLRDSTALAWDRWSNSAVKAGTPFDVAEISRDVWDYLVRHALPPPTAPDVIVDQIVSDRRAQEGESLRLRHTDQERAVSDKKTEAPKAPKEKTASAAGRAPRIPENSTVTFGKNKEGVSYGESNPKRAGTPSAERFGKYRSGMTVKQAIDAGVSSADIRYDADKGFIVLTAPAAEAA